MGNAGIEEENGGEGIHWCSHCGEWSDEAIQRRRGWIFPFARRESTCGKKPLSIPS
jgi:hypothetical protein